MKKDKNNPKGGNSRKTVKTASLLILTLVFALVLSGAASAGTPLAENQTGTVSGDLYVNTTNPWSSTTLGATNEVTQANTLPTYTSIDSAMVYVNIYSGSGTSNWPVRTTIKLDGNGDGDYDDAGELLGVEDMNIPGTTDGTVYWLNDHCNRVYSDYQVWYDVKNLITSNNPTLYVKTETIGGDGYDGRIKLLALCVAYNDGDTDKVDYWVINGQDWINSDTSPSTSTFNTSSFTGQVSSATLNTVALSGTDGTYTLNTSSLTGNLTETGSYYKEHQWDVTGNITPGADTNLTYANVGSSLKMNLATLTIREVATTPPAADFTSNVTSGDLPLTVNFTNTSTGTITSYAWDFNNDGTTDSTDQNPSWIYNNRGTYTVKLTVTGPEGTDTETKTDLINVTGAKTWIVATDGTGDYTDPIEAISVAISGDTIFIKSGTYGSTSSWWNITTPNLTIIGEGADLVTIIGGSTTINESASGFHLENLRCPTVLLKAPNCVVESIKNSKDSGITIYATASNCVIRNNTFKYCTTAISVASGSTHNLIANNLILNSTYYALQIVGSFNTIRDNVISGSTGGYGSRLDGNSNLFENNIISNTSGGNGVGLYVGGYSNNIITKNSFINNGTGIRLSKSSVNNYVYLNTFSGNTVIASTSGTPPSTSIFWVSPEPVTYTYNGVTYSAIMGNYWGSSYTDPDADGNGIGDAAFTLPAGLGTDTAPLMYPFSGYTVPVADFSATPTLGTIPLSVSFTDKTSEYITSWAWDFNNDGIVDSTEKNPSWTYTTAGTYTVKLTVSNAAGSDDEVKTDYITVFEPDIQAPTVTANPVGGTLTTATQVILSATDNVDPNPVIYYTTDGTDPTSSSILYTGTINIFKTTTLKCIAVDASGNISPVQSETYIDSQSPSVTASRGSGTYTSITDVILSATDDVDPNPVIYYTTDGTDPTSSSILYTGSINIPKTTTLKFMAVDASGNISPVQSETYTINDTDAPVVSASLNGVTVNLTATDNVDPNPAIYYTTDGTDPTTSSTLYTGTFTIPRAETTTVKFFASDATGNTSEVQSETYTAYYVKDLVTSYYAEGNVGVIVSLGGTAYGGGDPTYILDLPEGATILSAHLCLGWTWYGYMPYSVTFNGSNVTNLIAHYPSYSGYYGYSDGDGQDVYDVTAYVTNGTNTATIGHTGTCPDPEGRHADYARVLIVVYQCASEPYRQIWVNEGFHNLYYEGNTATAFFQNVTTNNVASAEILTMTPSGDSWDEETINLNGVTINRTSFGGSDPSFNYFNVTNAIQNDLNTLNVIKTTEGAYFSLQNAILTLTMQPADLTISNLQTNNPQVGTNTPVTATVTNNGGTNASNFLVKLYDNNIQVAKTTLASLAAGASLPVSFDWTPTTAGNHVLAIITDAGSQITESDENNNLVSAEVAVSPSAQPDLIATNLMLPVSPVIGTTNQVTTTITNQGAVDSSTFVVKLYDNNTQYATINLAGLAAGASAEVTFNWSTLTSGAHNLSVIADANQQISEYNEANNQISQQATVNQSTLPDMTVTNLQVPASPAVAANSQVTATVTNLGTVDSGAFVVKLYDNNTQIAKINLTGLAAGASADVTFNWSTLTSGAHNLSVIADANQQITEYNEANNQISQQTTVNPATQPDLTVTDLQLPSNPVAGTTYQVTAMVTNLGTDTGTFAVKLYDNNTQLGKINITSLSAGTSTQVTFNWTPTTGTHNLAIKADANNQITEYNEANNQITQQATVN